MSGDARSKFCGSCKKNVYNLSAMTEVEAKSLIEEKEGNLCVTFYQRVDGTVLTSDCSVGLQKRRRRNALAAMAASIGAAFTAALSACSSTVSNSENAVAESTVPNHSTTFPTMGKMLPPTDDDSRHQRTMGVMAIDRDGGTKVHPSKPPVQKAPSYSDD